MASAILGSSPEQLRIRPSRCTCGARSRSARQMAMGSVDLSSGQSGSVFAWLQKVEEKRM